MFAARRALTSSIPALVGRRSASGLAVRAADGASALASAEEAKEKRMVKSMGANFLSEANDLKRPLPIVAEELNVPLETLESFVEVMIQGPSLLFCGRGARSAHTQLIAPPKLFPREASNFRATPTAGGSLNRHCIRVNARYE